ncbi:hypothetical protein KKF81_00355 [Candidatus Micrarchaeota archaeon]|nr:hypothetical protein [Candidatus Micrarchaeota archaeon]
MNKDMFRHQNKPSHQGRQYRAQVATEFMLYTTVFMFVAVIAFVIILQMQQAELPLQQNTVAKSTGAGFVNVIILSVKGGEGFSYNYTFPKTLFGRPYTIDFSHLASDKYLIIDWAGEYGNFSYAYSVPAYDYRIRGVCIASDGLVSNECSNVLTLNNNGDILTIEQRR